AWDFQYDGTTFNPEVTGTRTPTHQFASSGTYQVALRVTDGNGMSAIGVTQVVVNNVAPTATTGPDQTINVGDTASFSGTAFDPGGPGDIALMAWDFNYDGVVFQTDAEGASVAHTFNGPGTYTVAFQVTDGDADTGLSTLQVTVKDVPTLVVDP